MKETTQAKATANTAFGWRNGFVEVREPGAGIFYLT
jgi:hypothetical protein